jgi:uncharacterized protein (DUF58 family)
VNVLIVFLVLGALYCALGLLLTRFGLKGLQCTRSFSRLTFFEGEEGELVEVVRNDRPMLIPWLRLESNISPHLRLGRQENLSAGDARHYASLFTLMPYQQVRRRHRVRFLHRGTYDLGNATLTAGDVLGLFQRSREQSMHVPVLVFPRLLEDDRLPQPLSLLLGQANTRRPLLTDPFLVRGIRAYHIGDPVRDIHWPATARMGEAQVRLFDPATQTKLMVILNGQLRPDQWGELMDYEQDLIEHGISMAATLMLEVLKNGAAAGFATNMPFHDQEGCAFLPPYGGTGREEEVLQALARVHIHQERSILNCLEELSALRDCDVVLLTAYADDPELIERVSALRIRNRSVTVHLLRKEEVKQHAA